MTRSASSPTAELLKMVKTLADTKASVPPKHRGLLHKQYAVNVEVTRIFDALQYSASAGGLMPDLRFTMKSGDISVRSYKPGDWEAAVKKAYEDLVGRSGALAAWPLNLPEPAPDTGQKTPARRKPKTQKKRGLFDRLMGLFIESED